MKKNVLIVHYNTPKLTEYLVRSINKHVSDAIIYIFDNSDKAPFTAKFDNVTILDNTKGQIVNLNKWLEKYPNRNKSHGRINNWGSAKHCYSVDLAMNIINEPFVLLDSDVLVKKDFSCLYDESCAYIAEVLTQSYSTINRVLPFICFINTDMCKRNNIHYFNENMMHGLWCTKLNKRADLYDTGASFYTDCIKLKHKEIVYNDYAVHFGAGSWRKDSKLKNNPNNDGSEFIKEFHFCWDNTPIDKYPKIDPSRERGNTPKGKNKSSAYVNNEDLMSVVNSLRS